MWLGRVWERVLKRLSQSGQRGLSRQSKESGIFAKCGGKPLDGFKQRRDRIKLCKFIIKKVTLGLCAEGL